MVSSLIVGPDEDPDLKLLIWGLLPDACNGWAHQVYLSSDCELIKSLFFLRYMAGETLDP